VTACAPSVTPAISILAVRRMANSHWGCRTYSAIQRGCLTRSHKRSAEVGGSGSGSKAGIGCSASQGSDVDDYLKM
jgi:hypothetical protein